MTGLPDAARRWLVELWLVAFAVALVAWAVLTPPLRAMVTSLGPLAAAALFVLACSGLGSVVVRRGFAFLTTTDQVLASLALGFGLTAALVFATGLAGLVAAPLYAAWVVLGLVVAVPAAVAWWRGTTGCSGAELVEHPLDRLAAIIIVVTILAVIPAVTAPVCSTDALEYHLMIPKIHLAEGRIGPIPTVVEAGYPSLAPYLYLPVMALAGDVPCQSVHLFAGLALLVAVARLKQRVAPGGTRLLAPALVLTMPLVASAISVAWNDAFFVLFLLLALGLLTDVADGADQRLRRLVLAGVLVGLAAWTKYTVVMVLLALAPLLLWAMARWRWRLGEVIAFTAPIGLISLAVFVKNLAFTGNPFYPFLHRLFPTPTWNDAAAAYFSRALREWEIVDWSWLTYLSFPFHVTLTPRLADIHTGVVPLLLIPLLLVRLERPGATFLKGFILCHVAAWLLIHTENRSLLTLLAVLLALGTVGLERAVWTQSRGRRATVVVLAAAALTSLGMVVVNTLYLTEPIRHFLGRESRLDFLRRECESFPTLEWLNDRDEVVGALLVGLKRPYYLEKPGYFSAFADPPVVERLTVGVHDPDAVAARLAALGVSHVVVNQEEYRADHDQGLFSWPAEQRAAFEAFIAERCTPVFRSGAETVYQVGGRAR